jgi:hypothetical protein
MTALKKHRFPKIKGRDYFGVFPAWREPDDWRKVPFTHTITQTTCWGLPHFNPGTSLYLVEDRAPLRGELFIWCKKSFDGFPTAPVWGRFMASTPKGDKVLTTMGAVVVLPLGPGPLPTKADYAYRFRIVGNRYEGHSDREYARSEIPIPVPTSAETIEPAAAFDLLQHGVKALDNALQAMANVTELIDDVDDADKRSDNDKYLDRRYRKAQAYEALDHLLTTALDKSATLQSRLADYHKASPELAHWLSRWQADDAKA